MWWSSAKESGHVAPSGFRSALISFTSEIWIPGVPDQDDGFALARLRPDVGLERARIAIDDLALRLERRFPATNEGVRS